MALKANGISQLSRTVQPPCYRPHQETLTTGITDAGVTNCRSFCDQLAIGAWFEHRTQGWRAVASKLFRCEPQIISHAAPRTVLAAEE